MRSLMMLAVTFAVFALASSLPGPAAGTPVQAQPGFIHDFEGYQRNFHEVAFSPDGRYVVSCSGRSYVNSDDHIRLYDVKTGKEIRRFEDPKDPRRGLADHVDFSPTGRQLLAVAGTVISIWDVETGKRLQQIAPGFGERAYFSADGKRLAVLSGGPSAIWDLETGEELQRFTPEDRRGLPHVARFADVYPIEALWFDLLAGKEIARLHASGRFSADGRHRLGRGYVQDGPSNELMLLHDAQTSKVIHTFYGPKAGPMVMAFSPDGKRILSGHDFPDSTIRLWDVTSGKELWQAEAMPYPACLAFSPDGRYAVVGTIGGRLSLWRLPE